VLPRQHVLALLVTQVVEYDALGVEFVDEFPLAAVTLRVAGDARGLTGW